MTVQLSRSIGNLERSVVKMGELVQLQLDTALAALAQRDAVLAEEVLRGDDELDRLDVRVEVEGLRILHDHQLHEDEFRMVVAIVKIDTQLERIGDLAVNLAERAAALAQRPPLPKVETFDRMAERVQRMVAMSIEAFVEGDPAHARSVLALDQGVDDAHRELFEVYEGMMREDGGAIERAVQMLSCSRHLERIGDHAKNMAEDVVYMVEGAIIRHGGWPPAAAQDLGALADPGAHAAS